MRRALGRAHDVVVDLIPAADRRQLRRAQRPATAVPIAGGRRRPASPHAQPVPAHRPGWWPRCSCPRHPWGWRRRSLASITSCCVPGYGSGGPPFRSLAPTPTPRRPWPASSSSVPTRTWSIRASRVRMARAARRRCAGRGARPVRALPRLPDRRGRRTGCAGRRRADRLAAPDPLVRHDAAAQAVGRRGPVLRLGLRPGRQRLARQGSVVGDLDRRQRRGLPPRRPEPLLLRRLPAALRADCAVGRHALSAAAGIARRTPGQRGRSRGPRADLRVAPAELSRLARDRRHRTLRRARGAEHRPTAGDPPDGPRHQLAHDQPDLPGRGSDRGAAGACARIGVDHRLPRRGHRHRPLGPGPGDRCTDHPHGGRVRCRADAVPGRPRTRAAAAVGDAAADLRLGLVAGWCQRGGDDGHRHRLRRGLAGGAGGGAGPGHVVDRDRPGRAGRAQCAAHAGRPGRARRGAVPGRGGDPDPGAAASAARGRAAGHTGRRWQRLVGGGQGRRRHRRAAARRPPGRCARPCAGSRAAARRRSSPPRRCCWCWPPRR